jgi:DNA-binding winged helix-turn-helix (wHTH) protein
MLGGMTNSARQDAGMPPSRVRLGEFELDLRAGELRRGSETVRLQQQPFQILLMLLKREGELVTREEIRRELWPDGTIVEFEHSINSAVRKLRIALQDSADSERYVETVGRRGYRLSMPSQCEHRAHAGISCPPAAEPSRGTDTPAAEPLAASSLSATHNPRRRLRKPFVVQASGLRQRLRRLEQLVHRMRRPRYLRPGGPWREAYGS